jgi:hypothetical protein
MYKESFKKIVANAFSKSNNFYANNQNENKPNPYFVGFGNPNAKILILGKEKGFDVQNVEQLKKESIENPLQWNDFISKNIFINKEPFYGDSHFYTNVYFPYLGGQKAGHTWSKYQYLLQNTYLNFEFDINDFLKFSFISEINPNPSKTSNMKSYNDEDRLSFLSNEFYQSFSITILACGNYLSQKQIETIFDVNFLEDKGTPRNRLLVYKSENRILINTRQLSMDVSYDYLNKIATEIFPYSV